MIAKLSKGSTIQGALNYNEKKVAEGSAELLSAHKFGKEKQDLSFNDKVDKFKSYTDQNNRAKVNSYHYSLNFHENDQLDNEQLKEIAGRFMKAVKFGDQPFLVYRHHDSGHPHIHIVSTNIQADGKRIKDSWNARLMRNCAEEIERDYKLTLTGNNLKKLGQRYQYPGHDNQINPVEYPERNLRNKISDIVAGIHNDYKYKSFDDYNELLSSYNLKAIRLNGRSIKQDDIQANGLAYQTVRNGKETGVPIYASEILHLGKFNINEVDKAIARHSKQGLAERLERVTSAFLEGQLTYKPSSLHKQLQARGFTPLRKASLLSEDTKYLDQETKAVVNLKDIGDPKVRSAMEKKRNSFDMSKEEGEGITQEIQDLYYQTKKQYPERYFLESRMIKDIDNTDFKAMAAMKAGKYSSEKVSYQVDNFLAFKKGSFLDIERKEKQRFTERCRKAYQYGSHLSQSDTEILLRAMDIKTLTLGHLIFFEHTKYRELESDRTFYIDMTKEAQKTNLLKDKPGLSDMKMIMEYAGLVNSEQARDKAVETAVYSRAFPAGYALLKEKDKVDFQTRFTKNYIERIHWESSKTTKALIRDLAGKGVLVGKDDYSKEFVIGLHGFDKRSYLEVSEPLNKMLATMAYDEKEERLINTIIDGHLKDKGPVWSGEQPTSMVLLKEPVDNQKKESSLLQKIENLDESRLFKNAAEKSLYGDTTQSLDPKKKKKRRRRLM